MRAKHDPSNASGAMTAQEKRSSISLAGIFALRMLGLFLILPVFAVYARHLPGGDSDFLVGLTLGIYGLTQSVLQIPFGAASDRLGRKPVIVAGLLLFIAGSVVAAMGTTIWAVMIGRALQGAGAISAAVTALIADSVRDHVITKAMALVGASIGLTFAFSLVAAPPLTELWGVPGLFWLTAVLSAGAVWIVLKVVPDVPAVATEEADDHQPWPKVAFDPQLMRLNAGIFCLHCVQMALFVVIPTQLVEMGLPVLHHWYIYLPAVLIGFAVMMKPIIWAERNRKVASLLRMNVLLLGGGIPRDALLHRLQHPRGHAARPHLAHGPQGRQGACTRHLQHDAELRALRRRRRGRLDRPTFFIAGRVLCIEFCYALLVPACTWPQGAQAPQTA